MVTKWGPRQPGSVVDVGSFDVNGTFRPIFSDWHYVGVDVREGKGVDLVMTSPYQIPLPDEVADVVVCGSTLEHVDFFWLLWQEMVRILQIDAFLFITVPSKGQIHRYPRDCWRFLPDSMAVLADWGDLTLLEVNRDLNRWGDVSAAFQKAHK